MVRPMRLLPFLGSALAVAAAGAGAAAAEAEPFHFGPHDSVLVVAPHPDDESLCCAGVLQRARAAGARVAIVWITGGDAFELDARLTERTLRPGRAGLLQLGMRRAAEASEAASKLGVPESGRYLLGYPDRGIQHLALDNYFIRYHSPFTGADRVFLQGALRPDAPYEGQSLMQDLRTVVERQQPSYVFVASPLDAHPDHRFSGELVIRLMGERRQLDRVWYWIVHGGLDWPRPGGFHPGLRLNPPRTARKLDWVPFDLTTEEQDTKLAALSAHRSQMDIMGGLMRAFVRQNELFTQAVSQPSSPAPAPAPFAAPESSIIDGRTGEESPP